MLYTKWEYPKPHCLCTTKDNQNADIPSKFMQVGKNQYECFFRKLCKIKFLFFYAKKENQVSKCIPSCFGTKNKIKSPVKY